MSYERPRGSSRTEFFLSGLKCFLGCRTLCNMKTLLHTIVLSLVLGAGSVGCSKEDAGAKQVNVPAMIDALKGQDNDARINACVELAKAGPRAKAAVPSLIPLLKDQDPLARRLAAYALGEIGPEANSALPGLKALLNDTDRAVVMQAVNSLRSIDPKNYSGLKNVTVTGQP